MGTFVLVLTLDFQGTELMLARILTETLLAFFSGKEP